MWVFSEYILCLRTFKLISWIKELFSNLKEAYPEKTVLNTIYFWHVPSAEKLSSGDPHIPFLSSLWDDFVYLHDLAGGCSFACLWLALLFCGGPLEAPTAVSSQCSWLCPRSGEQGISWGLVAERRMTIWPGFSLLPGKYCFHADATSHHCHKVHLTMPGETPGAGVYADKTE